MAKKVATRAVPAMMGWLSENAAEGGGGVSALFGPGPAAGPGPDAGPDGIGAGGEEAEGVGAPVGEAVGVGAGGEAEGAGVAAGGVVVGAGVAAGGGVAGGGAGAAAGGGGGVVVGACVGAAPGACATQEVARSPKIRNNFTAMEPILYSWWLLGTERGQREQRGEQYCVCEI
ncbi:glycine-rich cell wall structural protein [Lotus japonicus]|uniref:glycine-rich cell wall structural protein n=1 Tax=Lotus japonicus TaxID=34305 RepID=UPI002582F771|nr:glycine-rich cell wall structural protein [Lotus japonicus]